MSFLLTLLIFVSVIAATRLYKWAGVLFEWLKKTFPPFMANVLTKGRQLYMRATKVSDPPTKELKRKRAVVDDDGQHLTTLRELLSTRLTEVENNDGQPIQEAYRAYLKYVPEYYRQRDSEQEFPLPRWMEQSILFFRNPNVKFALAFFAVYVALLIVMPILIPITPVNNSNMDHIVAVRTSLHELIDLDVGPCHWHNSTTYDKYATCFLRSCDLLNASQCRDITGRTLSLRDVKPSAVSSSSRVLSERDLVIDENQRILYPLDFVVPAAEARQYTFLAQREVDGEESGYSFSAFASYLLGIKRFNNNNRAVTTNEEEEGRLSILKRYVNAEQHILPILKKLYKEERIMTENVCICPLFLNIVSNVSFHYEKSEQRWIVMHDAMIVRTNTFYADLVGSRLVYVEGSNFYKKQNPFVVKASEEDDQFVHYDSFVVEYTGVTSLAHDEISSTTAISEANDKLREASFKKARIFKRVSTELHRTQIALSGSDAVCFVYCDRLSKQFRARV